jgi:Flp pilus assembly protein TadD
MLIFERRWPVIARIAEPRGNIRAYHASNQTSPTENLLWATLKGANIRMPGTTLKLIAVIAVIAGAASQVAVAGDTLRITIPRRSELTPVQKLNREGVDAVNKRDYEKASKLFYKAYLYDPADPFTLNNLGYISELQGELDRAHKFYTLASEQGSNANIDKSNAKGLQGKPMLTAFASLQDLPMRVNRINVDSMRLLSQGRGFEAIAMLQKALALDTQNPFTLNNLGVASEAIGDFDSAMKFYNQASSSSSSEPVIVTVNKSWRGKPVRNMAADSAKRLQARISKMDPAQVQAIKFTMRGVEAANQNDWGTARESFLKAFQLDPASAFALNNRGYVAEQDGDLETAQFFYDRARKADDAGMRVGLATQQTAEGESLVVVAKDSNRKVDGELDKYSEERRREGGPIELTPRSSAPQQSTPTPQPQQ